jgi:hypothetical protein
VAGAGDGHLAVRHAGSAAALTDIWLARRLLGVAFAPLLPAVTVSTGAVLVMVLTGSQFAVVRESGSGAPVALPWLAFATSAVATIPSTVRGPQIWFEGAQPSFRYSTVVLARLVVLAAMQAILIAVCQRSLPPDAPQLLRIGPALVQWTALQAALVVLGVSAGVPSVYLVLLSSLCGTVAALTPPESVGSLIGRVPGPLPGVLLFVAIVILVARPRVAQGTR